jgi:hypothetical protein
LTQAEVGVGDDQLHPAKPTGLQAAKELGPERPVLAVTDGEAEDLASPQTPVVMTTAWATTRRLTLALQ